MKLNRDWTNLNSKMNNSNSKKRDTQTYLNLSTIPFLNFRNRTYSKNIMRMSIPNSKGYLSYSKKLLINVMLTLIHLWPKSFKDKNWNRCWYLVSTILELLNSSKILKLLPAYPQLLLLRWLKLLRILSPFRNKRSKLKKNITMSENS